MNTYEVPRAEWRSFFDQFSRIHQGQPVEVETIDPRLGRPSHAPSANTRGVPLLGITAQSESPDEAPQLNISAGDQSGIELGHSIAAPCRVQVSEWNDGISAALEIEAEDGRTTRVRVGPAEEMLPPGFIVDGI